MSWPLECKCGCGGKWLLTSTESLKAQWGGQLGPTLVSQEGAWSGGVRGWVGQGGGGGLSLRPQRISQVAGEQAFDANIAQWKPLSIQLEIQKASSGMPIRVAMRTSRTLLLSGLKFRSSWLVCLIQI